RAHIDAERPNIEALSAKAQQLAESIRALPLDNSKATPTDLELYQDVVFYILYQHMRLKFEEYLLAVSQNSATRKIDFYREFLSHVDYFFDLPDRKLNPRYDPAHPFAAFFQIRR